MKNYLNFNPILRLSLLSLLLGILSISSGCVFPVGSPNIGIIIENQTDQLLTIYYAGGGDPLGDIALGEQIIIERDGNSGEYPITAKNAQGEIVFSETYTFMPDDKFHLQETDEVHEGVVKVYKAVIPPLQNN